MLRSTGSFLVFLAVVFVVLHPALVAAKVALLAVHARVVFLMLLVALGLDVAVSIVRSIHRRRQRRWTLQGFLELSPGGFEQAVASLLRTWGYRHVTVTGGAGDLGVDITCRGSAGEPVVVQCKRWAPDHRVGSAVLQSFIGMVYVQHRASRGILVTTSSFSPAARALARRHRIELIDGSTLVDLSRGGRGRRRLPAEQRVARRGLPRAPGCSVLQQESTIGQAAGAGR